MDFYLRIALQMSFGSGIDEATQAGVVSCQRELAV